MKIIITESQLKSLLKESEVEGAITDALSTLNNSGRVDGSKMKVSQNFWDWIKYHEGSPKSKGEPLLKTYVDSVGVYTIGYGHTGSYAKPGKTITKDTATDLLYDDAGVAADCVRRFLTDWKDANKPGYKLKQHEFDALVSLVYNSGCSGVRTSDFIQSLKKGDYTGAANGIKNYKSSGLENRREAEYSMFKSGVYKKN